MKKSTHRDYLKAPERPQEVASYGACRSSLTAGVVVHDRSRRDRFVSSSSVEVNARCSVRGVLRIGEFVDDERDRRHGEACRTRDASDRNNAPEGLSD